MSGQAKKNVILKGLGALPTNTVIDGQKASRILSVSVPENVTIESITLQGGTVVNDNGGAINAASGSNLAFIGVNFLNNTATQEPQTNLAPFSEGGAVYSPGCMVYANNCSFGNNYASYYGGVANGGTWEANNCTFSNNTSYNCGGVFDNISLIANSCNFISNESTTNLGGVIKEIVGTGEMIGCTFNYNRAPNGCVIAGGNWIWQNCAFNMNGVSGIPIGSIYYSDYATDWTAVMAYNCRFSDNSTGYLFYRGGMTATNCILNNNNCLFNNTSTKLVNCSLYKNSGYLSDLSISLLINCVIWGSGSVDPLFEDSLASLESCEL